jgi:hypothetical protein
MRFQSLSVRGWRPLNGFREVDGAARGPAYQQYPTAATAPAARAEDTVHLSTLFFTTKMKNFRGSETKSKAAKGFQLIYLKF